MSLLTRQRPSELPPVDLSAIALTNDPDYKAAWDKLQNVRGELTSVENEISSVSAARTRQVSAHDLLTERATALLDGRPEPEVPAGGARRRPWCEDRTTETCRAG